MSIDIVDKGGGMRLTTKSEYSLLALIYIARYGRNSYVKIEDICKEYGISKKYLEHLLMILKQNRYVRTRRGARGGYALAKPGSKINVAQIIRLMDGALAPTESVSLYYFSETPLMRERKIMAVFKDIRDYAAKKLEKLKLSDLV
jgi:Rrf2 family cysteine metabolism transcriptional repressor